MNNGRFEAVYAWDRWFGKDEFRLVRGVDYQCSQSTMCQSVRNAASKRGIRVSIRDNGNGIVVRVKRMEDEIPRADQAAISS